MKRFIALFLVVVLIIGLVGCSAQQETLQTDSEETVTSELTSDSKIDIVETEAETKETLDELSTEAVKSTEENVTVAVTQTNASPATTTSKSMTGKSTAETTHTHKYKKSEKTEKSTVNGKTVKITTTTYTCSCGDTYTDIKEETSIKGHSHKYTATITTKATCTKAGVKTYKCDCGGSYTETIPATGHSFFSTVVAPTEFEDGYTLHICLNCKYAYDDNRTPATHKHSYTSSVTKKATCTATGTKTYKCSCGNSYTEAIAATGHDWKSTTVHHDAEYGTRDITETYTRYAYFTHITLDDKWAYLDNQAEMRKDEMYYYKYKDKEYGPTYTIKIAEYYIKDEEFSHWVYKYRDTVKYPDGHTEPVTRVDQLNLLQGNALSDFMDEYNWGVIGSYGDAIIKKTETKVIGTETYVITEAYDETVTTCTKCGSRK